MTKRMKEKIEEDPEMPAEKAMDVLLCDIEEIGRHGVRRVIEKTPDLLLRTMRKLRETDAAKFAREAPRETDTFMDILWEGVSIFVEKSLESKLQLERIDGITVNLEASDGPLTSHVAVREGRLSGGSGLLHFKDQDVRFFGPANALIGVLLGDVDLKAGPSTGVSVEALPFSRLLLNAGVLMRLIPKLLRTA